ncbi:MAG: hypothetical protein ACOYMN_25475 [Roseimicrobium sp.]
MQVSWIDPAEFQALVAALLGPQHGLTNGSAQPAPTTQLPPRIIAVEEADEASPNVARIREQLRHIRHDAEQAGVLATPALARPKPVAAAPLREHAPPVAPIPPMPPVEPSAGAARLPACAGPLAERLAAFAAWAAKLTLAQELVIGNEHGDLLWGTPAGHDLTLTATLAAKAAMRTQSGSPVKIRPSKAQEFVVLSCTTSMGTATLALGNPKSTPTELLIPALATALDPA